MMYSHFIIGLTRGPAINMQSGSDCEKLTLDAQHVVPRLGKEHRPAILGPLLHAERPVPVRREPRARRPT